mgnify:CR=1 FL=1
MEAWDCIKDHSQWKTTLGLIRANQDTQKNKTKRGKQKKTRSIAKSIASEKENLGDTKGDKPKTKKTTKLERKAYYEECKRTLNKTWRTSDEESSDDSDGLDVPSNFRSYTIQDWKIMLQQPKQVKLEAIGESYDE